MNAKNISINEVMVQFFMENNMKQGTVYWLTGLSGAGKTTIGYLFYNKIYEQKKKIFRLDGDIARWPYNDVTDYSIEARRECAFRHARVCKMLADQGIDVICCTISMFKDVRKWNSENLENYVEIFLDAPMDILYQRNQKGLYEKGKDVMGVDQKMELPDKPDIYILNDGSETPENIAEILFAQIKSKL